MNFEVFKRPGRAGRRQPRPTPTVAVTRSGVLSLNRAAAQEIGAPAHILLLYDRTERVIGVRATVEEDPDGRVLRFIQGSASYAISAQAFFTYYHIDYSVTRRYIAAVVDGVLCVSLA